MPVPIILFLVAATTLPLSAANRVDYERTVERARYAFVIGNTRPFDEVYPRGVFEKRVDLELSEEHALRRTFGLTVTPTLLAQEFDRIEKTTKAPDQWEAIKNALGGNRRLIEEVFCRPLLVDRALRSKFAFDQKIHARPHQQAREARGAFLAGKTPGGAKTVVIARRSAVAQTTEDLLAQSRSGASGAHTLIPARPADPDAPLSPDPEIAAVLKRELKQPGDVTTILEERDRFEVFRLIGLTDDAWRVEAFRVPKVDFDRWLQSSRRSGANQ